MEVRYLADRERYQKMNTAELRRNFLLEDLFENDTIKLNYLDIDRGIIGSAVPLNNKLKLEASKKEMAADYFTERREVGIINIGNSGSVTVDGSTYDLENRDMLYIGKESKEVLFSSSNSNNPAKSPLGLPMII